MLKATFFFASGQKTWRYIWQKLMDTAAKAGIDALKTVSKRVVQKTATATVDLIENKIADKIKQNKEKEEDNEANLHTSRKTSTNY